MDSLQWEVNRLDAENRKLRAEYPVASECVDLEAELEQSRSDGAELTSRVLEYEKQREAEGQELKQTTCEPVCTYCVYYGDPFNQLCH